jgi:hypothetical protein
MPDSKITIRLPEDLAAKLTATADRHEVTRTAILLDLLVTGLDDWQPVGQRTAPSDVARLEGAIEVLRLELTEAVERIDRLERQANAQRRPAVSAQPRPATTDKPEGTMTQADVLRTIGIPRSTARDRAAKAGLSLADWIEANSSYRRSGGGWEKTE